MTASRDAIALARRGEGSLAARCSRRIDAVARELVLGLAPYHGRVLVVNRTCAKESTGHGSPLPHLVHGGPGRAGGGEEMGGIRGVLHYMQRTAVQGSPDTHRRRSADAGRAGHASAIRACIPFASRFTPLQIGDTFHSPEREVTLADIERIRGAVGRHFLCAHGRGSRRARNPLFGGRVAHGYFLVSAAAGLVRGSAVRAGARQLRARQPALHETGQARRPHQGAAHLQGKIAAPDKGYGEVRWDTEITNQDGETVASYDVLTMVSEKAIPDAE